jgi:hypothetical protein
MLFFREIEDHEKKLIGNATRQERGGTIRAHPLAA